MAGRHPQVLAELELVGRVFVVNKSIGHRRIDQCRSWRQLRWRRLSLPVLCSAGSYTSSRPVTCHYWAICPPFPLPPPDYFFPPPSCQSCPFHIWHMATLRLMLVQLRTCTLRTTLHHNIPLLILQQPSLANTNLPQAPSHAPLGPAPGKVLPCSLERSILDWKTLSNWRFWIRREWLCAYRLPIFSCS